MAGFGYGHGTPQTAKDVAAAFFAGRERTRSNCRTDGKSYELVDTVIARRLDPDEVPTHLALALLGKTYQRPLEFSFNGWPTDMTCRHLNALGIKAEIVKEYSYGPKGGMINPTEVPLLNGRQVSAHRWYTLEELATMPKWVQPPWEGPKFYVAPADPRKVDQMKLELV